MEIPAVKRAAGEKIPVQNGDFKNPHKKIKIAENDSLIIQPSF